MKVGINSISYYIPKIHLPIETLAINRDIDPLKLIKGLGLQKMALLDTNQDVVTLAANAALQLIKDNEINLSEISKIYVGTESGVDSSKPIASYVIGLLEQVYGERILKNCDAIDHTFACIGAVDAMLNAIDFVKANPTKKAIVIATDFAKYDLNSTGEYTQGAGAIALLITANPNLLAFDGQIGVATESVFDFFKPRRTVAKSEITANENNDNWFDVLESEVSIYKEQPVFEGQYSNQCYINRITEAYAHFKSENAIENVKAYQNWKSILMHLPYCYQGRRTFYEILLAENPEFLDSNNSDVKDQIKAFTKSETYLKFVEEKICPSEIASGQVGNIYTGSIFLGLLSALTYFAENDTYLANEKLGFIAYGSGSKSKVFEGQIQQNWRNGLPKISIFDALKQSKAISFTTYESLHKKELKAPVLEYSNEFILDYIENENPNLLGARFYKYI